MRKDESQGPRALDLNRPSNVRVKEKPWAGSVSPSVVRDPVRVPAYELRNTVHWRIEQDRIAVRAEYRRAMPCWLTSMVLHMVLMIVLGSLAIPPAKQFLRARLLASFAEPDDLPAASRPALVSMDLARYDGGAFGDLTRHEGGADAPRGDRLQEPSAELAEAQPAATERLPPPAELGAPMAEIADEKTDAAPKAPQPARLGVVAATARAAPPERLSAGPVEQAPSSVSSSEERRLDGVVNRFIEFDIGRLRGREGERARREFEQLGPEAIRALVRGLNKAAKIYASCPVVVISNKLGQLAGRDSDPEVLEYVLDNLGKDVPASAPHFARLRSLKASILNEAADAPAPLNDAARLSQQLSGASPAARLSAARQIAARAEEWSGDQRGSLAWLLIRRLSDRPAEMRDAAHAALVALAEGKDFGPAENKRAPAKEVSAAAGRWYDHFDHERFEAMGAGVLASARHFEDARRRTSAERYYRKVLDEYAGTRAAGEAAQRLEALAGPRTLEQ